MTKHFCFDLEDTLIAPVLSGWRNWEPILENCSVFKRLIREELPDTVNIFSFAIHDENDHAQFNHHVRPQLSKLLGISDFFFVPTVLGRQGSIRTLIANQRHMQADRIEFSDMVDFWSKDLAFQLWAKRFGTGPMEEGMPPNEVHLFDDAVEDSEVLFPHRNLKLVLHRVA